MAVQIVVKESGEVRIINHLGSAHSEGELAAFLRVGHQRLNPGQVELDLGLEPKVCSGTFAVSQSSRLLVDVIRRVWDQLELSVIDDQGFFQLVLARLAEPTSMVDSQRILEELGVTPVQYSTFKRALSRAGKKDYLRARSESLFRSLSCHQWPVPVPL